MGNILYYGDNLDVLSRYVGSESVDLIYLDPPFNSNADYNVLFAEHGERAASQIKAFEDTWHWDTNAVHAYQQVVEAGGRLSEALQALRTLLGDSDMLAYLSMMAPRLKELHRVLRTTGGLYLHCDPTASHYLKVLLDAVFGGAYFVNEIVWKRTTTKNDYKQGALNWARIHDVILHYRKDLKAGGIFRQPFADYDASYVQQKYPHADPDGRRYGLWDLTAPGSGTRGHPQYEFMGVTRYWRYNREKMETLAAEGRVIQPGPGKVPRYKRYLDEMPGIAIGDLWDDIPPINSQAQERLGYPTQKPLALLERIIQASSNEGDVVLDPFCGCGTAIDAAQRLNRRWLGIDITHLAVNLIKHRLASTYGEEIGQTYEIIGEPTSLQDAAALAAQDKFQFQAWALGLVNARVAESGKKGADKGIDGKLFFHENPEGTKTQQVIFSVKGGHVPANHVRELRGVIDREKAAIGVLITLETPSKPMRAEAADAGVYTSPWGQHPRLQILTVEELLDGRKVDMPPRSGIFTFKKAPRHSSEKQMDLTDAE